MAEQQPPDSAIPSNTPFPFGGGSSSGGQGAELDPAADRGPSRSDIRLARTAFRRRYPIGSELRRNMIKWLADIAEHCDEPRTRVNAIKALLTADAANQHAAEAAAKAEIEREKAKQAQEINVNVSGGIQHEHGADDVFAKIAALTGQFAARRLSDGGTSGGADASGS